MAQQYYSREDIMMAMAAQLRTDLATVVYNGLSAKWIVSAAFQNWEIFKKAVRGQGVKAQAPATGPAAGGAVDLLAGFCLVTQQDEQTKEMAGTVINADARFRIRIGVPIPKDPTTEAATLGYWNAVDKQLTATLTNNRTWGLPTVYNSRRASTQVVMDNDQMLRTYDVYCIVQYLFTA